ncbi:aminotransferase class I/II-fold pyridoxal phosphate-dependent enzyme [Massilia sp. LMS1-1-1.1]
MPDTEGFNTRAIHAGYEPADAQGALIAPIHMTSTFAFATAEDATATFAGEREQFVYGRVHNPTQALLEARIASLEGGEAALATASGMGAISSLLWSVLRPGDQVVVHRHMYGNSFTLFRHELPSFGIDVVFADLSVIATATRAITERTRMVFFESPTNPQLEIIDIAQISAIAGSVGAITVVDNTFCSPYLQLPLKLGADIVVHSMTKYLCGHGDVLAGVVVGTHELIKTVRMKGLRYMTGATISPMAAFLVLRGLKTLGLRMERHSNNAGRLARLLVEHPKVATVYYPGLASHPQFALSAECMRMPGGLISLDLRSDMEGARRLMNALKMVNIAVSLGDAETLIQHPASMTHASYGADDLREFGISPTLLRISIGLEDPEDIELDFMTALDAV